MFSLTAEETLIQSGGVLNTIAPTHLPPRLSLVPLEEEAKDDDYEFWDQFNEPLDHSQGRSKRLQAMQRAHRRTTRLTVDGWQMEATANNNANRVPFHTNNPYVEMGFWSYLAFNLTDPCCGTSDWIYDNYDYDGDLYDVDVDDNGLFWREYNPKRELYDLQLQVQDSTISERQRSYLEKKIQHMQRDKDPLAVYYFDDDEEEEEDGDVDIDMDMDMDMDTLLTMDESLAEGNMSAMEVAVRKYKRFEREQRYYNNIMQKEQKQQQQQQYYQQVGKTYSF